MCIRDRDIGVRIDLMLSGGVGDAEILIDNGDSMLLKALVDEFNGFSAMDKTDLHALGDADVNDLLQQLQHNDYPVSYTHLVYRRFILV